MVRYFSNCAKHIKREISGINCTQFVKKQEKETQQEQTTFDVNTLGLFNRIENIEDDPNADWNRIEHDSVFYEEELKEYEVNIVNFDELPSGSSSSDQEDDNMDYKSDFKECKIKDEKLRLNTKDK